MGKRSSFERIERDYYKTPKAAVLPLAPFLESGFRFYEPCAGDGRLTRHLQDLGGTCSGQSDIEPQNPVVKQLDALNITAEDVDDAKIITNPPWSRRKSDGYIFHRLIEQFVSATDETWLLADADWMHTVQAEPYMREFVLRVVSIGRVKWMEDTNTTGKDNCCWYQFSPNARAFIPAPLFYGRNIGPSMRMVL